MGADNWTLCPRCHKAKEDAVAAVKKLYGKINLEDFEKRMKEAKAQAKDTPEETLREDYEIGIRGGKFFVSYGAFCDCGFSHKFKYESPFLMAEDTIHGKKISREEAYAGLPTEAECEQTRREFKAKKSLK